MGFFNKLFSPKGLALGYLAGDDDEEREAWKAPEWHEDPDYRETQDFMKGLGMDILKGDVPEYYKGIGEFGSKEFEDMLQMTTSDITKSMLEGAAITGRGRGGGLAPQIAEITGDVSRKARYDDYMRALGGKEFLFSQGRGITEGARGAGLNTQEMRNRFNLNTEQMAFEREKYADTKEAEESDMFGNLLSTGISAGVGYATGGPAGAAMGAIQGFDWGSLMDKGGKQLPGTTTTKKDDALWLGKPYKKLSIN